MNFGYIATHAEHAATVIASVSHFTGGGTFTNMGSVIQDEL